MPKTIAQSVFSIITVLFALLVAQPGFAEAGATEDVAEKTTAISMTSGKININSANAAILSETLNGIGAKKAQAIIEYRDAYGAFADIRELQDVKGIGPATVEKNAHLIVVE